MTSDIGASLHGNSGWVAMKFTGKMGGSLLASMAALERSLEESGKALVCLDLAGLVTRTREQVRLSREVAAMFDEARDNIDDWPGRSPSDGELEMARAQMAELRMTAERIRIAVRLQSALLARSQAKLRVMANMLASPSVSYGPLLAARLRGASSGIVHFCKGT